MPKIFEQTMDCLNTTNKKKRLHLTRFWYLFNT